MKILVLGAAGMVGRKLIEKLLETGTLRGETVDAIHAFDVVEPLFDDARVTVQAGNITDASTVDAMVDAKPHVIFHLAAIVSGEAEADFEKGYSINLGGTNNLFDAIVSREGYVPRVVYASSIAVFGAPFPDTVADDFHLTPLTSYGTQKAIGELLLADYTRKGHMDGVGIRLPTIVVRPGKPNAAASGFFSNIIREPLVGEAANLPVDDDVMHWMASPRSAVHFCVHAAEVDGEKVGPRRNLSMPGLAITTGEMVDALRNYAGDEVANRVTRKPDATIKAIVDNWPRRFDASRAESLGFKAEAKFDDLIAAHVEDELGGKIG
ncbi:D-erythronate dehydrogenase [Ahrensia sp. R2A130]|uniref:D-erythronate dehydrogenase n=1 Tax=Ahrensia sp. R2A130 TaxID=744979 RepID=UPI0001E0BC8D|nr:D-erythronate dehydrogenase [Ahrensia sp. R2A130]EFL88750.1 NAD-dependent epimerase/dehydratase [Ahrensia sp. R2A130]